jgi:Zn-finger nucleic acid-binding protein
MFGMVEVEECACCKGTWFRDHELGLAKDEAEPNLVWDDYEPSQHPDAFRVSPRHLRCPDCGTKLVELDYDRSGVAIDYCTSCRGIWLDAGEFLRIIDALRHELDVREVPDYLRESLKQAKEVLSGPESHLSEWHDFRTVMKLLRYRFLAEHTQFTNFLMKFPRIS